MRSGVEVGVESELEADIIDQGEDERGDDKYDAGDARHPESGDDEEFQHQQDDAGQEEQNFPVGGETFQIVRGEEEQGRDDGDDGGQPKTGRLQLEVETSHDAHDQDAADDRVHQEVDDFLNRREYLLGDLGLFDSGLLQGFLSTAHHSFAEAVFRRLFRGEGQHFARIADTGNRHIGIDHGLRDVGVTAVAFGSGAHERAHVRLVLVGHDLAGLVHHGCRADGGPRHHIDAVAGDGDQRARRCRVVVDEDDARHLGVQQQRANLVRCIQFPGDPNVPLQMVQEVEVRVADRYYRLWDRRGREHVDDTELLETYDELRYILDELYRMKSGFTVDGVSYHAVDSTQVEVIPSLESYYRGAITVPATVNYNNINFRVTTVAQNAFRSEYLTAIFWYAGFALKATDLQSSQNPNLLLYVTEASMAPTDRDNVVINGFAKNIRLSEGGNFHCPQAFTAEAISYTREFKQQTQIGVSRGWETIALPFTVQTITHEQRGVIAPFGNTASNTHFWLRRLTSNGLQAVPTIEANTAYLISMPNSEEYVAEYNLPGRVTFSAENATVPMTEIVKDESADYVMTPCFTNAAAKQGIYVLNVGEQRSGYPEGSIFESNYRAVLPFQAYVEHKGSNPAPPYFIVGDLGGDTTGIDATLMNSERVNSEAWYTLDGRKLQGKPTQKGVYITNGKKVIIK